MEVVEAAAEAAEVAEDVPVQVSMFEYVEEILKAFDKFEPKDTRYRITSYFRTTGARCCLRRMENLRVPREPSTSIFVIFSSPIELLTVNSVVDQRPGSAGTLTLSYADVLRRDGTASLHHEIPADRNHS